jgi:hypothetical protein
MIIWYTYVAILNFRKLESLFFEKPFDFRRLCINKRNKTWKMREADKVVLEKQQAALTDSTIELPSQAASELPIRSSPLVTTSQRQLGGSIMFSRPKAGASDDLVSICPKIRNGSALIWHVYTANSA